MHRMEASINTWHDEVRLSAALNTDPTKKSQWEEMCLYADIARDYIIVTLFRPNPRVKEPRCENLMKAFIAGVGVADGYWKQSNLEFGNSKYVFHPCYHTFSGAVVFLQALQRCKNTIHLTYTVERLRTLSLASPDSSRQLRKGGQPRRAVWRSLRDSWLQSSVNMSISPSKRHGVFPRNSHQAIRQRHLLPNTKMMAIR